MNRASRLEDYLCKIIRKGKSGFICREATNIKIGKLSRLSGGISNDNYTFSLAYLDGGEIQELSLVLKVYREDASTKCWNEGQVLKALEQNNFPVPHLYIQETSEKILGAPFIIMEKVKGRPMEEYLKKLPRKERLDIIRRFAETLVLLHGLRWEDFGPNFLRPPTDEYDYARRQAVLTRRLKDFLNVKQDLDWAIDWLEDKASLHPCHQYSLLHGDMHLNNFLVTKEGKIVVVDWEYPEIGDALRDVGLAYHNIRLMLGIRNVNEGDKYGEYFIQHYIRSSRRNIDHSTLRFYMFSSALLEALCYRSNSARALNPLFVMRILGGKYIPVFPLVWWYFRSKSKILERFLVENS